MSFEDAIVEIIRFPWWNLVGFSTLPRGLNLIPHKSQAIETPDEVVCRNSYILQNLENIFTVITFK